MHNLLNAFRNERAGGDTEDGFTLIELLVVVVIIGVLVAIAIPLYLNYRTGAENKAAQSDVRSAVAAVEACIADNANKTPTGSGIAADGTASAKVINLTCDGSGAATAAAAKSSTAGTQTINVSDSVTVTYTQVTSTTYTIKGTYAGTGHKFYLYTSSTGKTTNPTA